MRVSLNNAFLIPMFFNIGIVVCAGLFYTIRERKRYQAPPRDRIYRCSVCEHVYADGRDTGLSRCPRCGCLNEPVRA